MKKHSLKNEGKGFSLIELMIILLIIGLLVISIAPKATLWIKKAEENRQMTEEETIKAAAEIAVTETLASEKYGNLKDGVYIVAKDGDIEPKDTFAKSMLEVIPSDTSFSKEYNITIKDSKVVSVEAVD